MHGLTEDVEELLREKLTRLRFQLWPCVVRKSLWAGGDVFELRDEAAVSVARVSSWHVWETR